MRISVIATGYNCEEYALECITSVLNQSYDDVELLIYNDGSTDLTKAICEPFTNSKSVWLMNSQERKGALYGRYALSRLAAGDVICFLGLDDTLPSHALETVAQYYDKDTMMTYGSFVDSKGRVLIAEPYSDEVWEEKSFRNVQWQATALNTFRKELLLKVPKEKLTRGGKFLTNCTDLAYSFPCLEMIDKEQCKVIKEIVYEYRIHKGNSIHDKDKTEIREYLRCV